MAKIAIDEGHGRYTPGKRCLKSLDQNETREWVLNNRVGIPLESYLKSAGHEILRVSDITGNRDVPLEERVRLANEWGADYYMSIHQNAGINGGTGGGTMVFVYPGATGITVAAQEAIYARAIARGGLKGNRADGTVESDLYVLRETNMPASLIECGFMDSATDIQYILNPEWSKQIALGIAEGICQIFGGTVSMGEWKQDAKGWWYRNADGSYPKSQWQQISGKWYYFNEEGYMVTGWKQVDGTWYFMDHNGAMQTGWVQDGDEWYYLDKTGAMVTGIQTIGTETFYFAADGHMCRTNDRGALV